MEYLIEVSNNADGTKLYTQIFTKLDIKQLAQIVNQSWWSEADMDKKGESDGAGDLS
jgi:hypothetical protein